MTDINSVVIIGRIVRDCSANVSQTGTSYANFSIAANRMAKGGANEASFFDVVLFGKTAEALSPYLLKGKRVCVAGYLKQDRWDEGGSARSKMKIIGERVQLLDGKKESDSGYQEEWR
jgi:single-strand DNA-binding protein